MTWKSLQCSSVCIGTVMAPDFWAAGHFFLGQLDSSRRVAPRLGNLGSVQREVGTALEGLWKYPSVLTQGTGPNALVP